MFGKLRTGLFCLGLCILSEVARAQIFNYPGCSALTAADFQNTELAAGKGLQEPVAFDLQADWNASGDSVLRVNIFFTERMGKVKYYDAATQSVTVAGTIPVLANTTLACCGGSDDNGLMGIAVDPGYRLNHWIYLWYSPPQSDARINPRLRLSRFTVTAGNTLDMASEKILIDLLTSKGEHRHAGGPMTFDAMGDLWVTLGQSGNDINYPTTGSQWSADSGLNQEWGPSNTASLRGSIFRIHPDDKATAQRTLYSGTYGPGYTIPAGNFGEYWAGRFQAEGKTELATQYRDPAKVLPEVYVKGNRSPHSITVHPTKHLMVWGEVNPSAADDEINLISHPVFGGMPYFIGKNIRVPYPGETKSAEAPTNTSTLNNGVTQLPPAMPSTMSGGSNIGNVVITGPFYAYNRALKNRDKLPPHLDNHFFHFSFAANAMWVNAVDTATATITLTTQVGKSLMRLPLRSPLAARIGPDGALYVLNYDGYYTTKSPAFERLRYVGSCILPPTPSAIRDDAVVPALRDSPLGMAVEGRHVLILSDTRGRLLARLESPSGASYDFTELRARYHLRDGLVIADVRTGRGAFHRKIVY